VQVGCAGEDDVRGALRANHAWLEDVLVLLLSLLVLDRFADYRDDQVMAPVRETSAQALAWAAAALPLPALHALLRQVADLQQSSLWEVRRRGGRGEWFLSARTQQRPKDAARVGPPQWRAVREVCAGGVRG